MSRRYLNTISHLLNLLIIDLVTVKAFVWAVLLLFLLEIGMFLCAIVLNNDRRMRIQYALHLVARAGIALVAVLILYSDALEVVVT